MGHWAGTSYDRWVLQIAAVKENSRRKNLKLRKLLEEDEKKYPGFPHNIARP